MSARFHLYLSGIADRSRSWATTVRVSARAADAVAKASSFFMRPILRDARRPSVATRPRLLTTRPDRVDAWIYCRAMRWFVRGDIDGFFGLALDNLVQLLLIDTLCRFVLGFPPELVYGRVLPGAAVSILVGNVFYAYQAKKLAERT